MLGDITCVHLGMSPKSRKEPMDTGGVARLLTSLSIIAQDRSATDVIDAGSQGDFQECDNQGGLRTGVPTGTIVKVVP